MDNTPVVVVGYNRPVSLKRILGSLEKAFYPNKNIQLIISIDRADNNQDVLKIADNFKWPHGDKKVNYNPENLGLRKHIIQCGDLSLKYGSVIILEDDLFVSPNFYFYAVQALEFSKEKNRIGGISLYNHQTNVHTRDNFIALNDGSDNYYFQFASSWGQAWTKKQWEDFKTWYGENPTLPQLEELPKNVANWSDKSWLKYFNAFIIETKRFFLYPNVSLTTNFSDAGTHVNSNSTGFQVPIGLQKKTDYSFSEFEESMSVYDSFYENKKLSKSLALPETDVCVDLYGYRNQQKKRYWLTSQKADFKIIKSYSRSLRPLELNVFLDLPGSDFFLYDTTKQEKNTIEINRFDRIKYNVRHLLYQDLVYLFKKETKAKVLNSISTLKSKLGSFL